MWKQQMLVPTRFWLQDRNMKQAFLGCDYIHNSKPYQVAQLQHRTQLQYAVLLNQAIADSATVSMYVCK